MEISLKTENLILKVLDPNDINAKMVSDFYANNAEFFSKCENEKTDVFYTLAYQNRILLYEAGELSQNKSIRFYVFKKDNPDKIIGTVAFYNMVGGVWMRALVGYKIDYRHTKNGYAKEALKCAIPFVATHFHIHRFEAYIQNGNTPSIKLVTSLNFIPEGIATDYIYIHNHYESLLRYVLLV